jgi:hypothetical protein
VPLIQKINRGEITSVQQVDVIHAHTHTHSLSRTLIHTCVHVCLCVCMCVCVCTCVRGLTLEVFIMQLADFGLVIDPAGECELACD